MELPNHELVPGYEFRSVRYEKRAIKDRKGAPVEGLHAIWITLDNEKQLNSYTTEALKELILAFRRASADRRAVVAVLTGKGDRAFCTGGNTAEYATLYASRPAEYAQYMRLFNDTVTSILLCDKPVVCRVNGMRIGGGQEIGMACDFSIAGDNASFGQAGPVHGSAPDGGSTDFLDLYVGYAFAAESLALCESWSAAKAYRLGLLNEVVPVYRDLEGKQVPNPLVVTDRFIDELGRIVYGDSKQGAARDEGKKRLAGLKIDLAPLDEAIDRFATRILHTFPDCTRKTLESLRKKKLQHWFANSETNRSWLALNMNAEAAAGFPAFHFGEKPDREIDFAQLRRRIAEGARFDANLVREVLPPAARKGWEESGRG
jgi:6-oxo-cyclohex-1-ene-carbonyl-CoA hydrolase